MGIMAIVVDGVALMIGSLLCAIACTLLAWWIAQRVHRCWLGPVLLLGMVAGMLVTGLERSLFVRMVSVFAVVGMVFIFFVPQDTDEPETRNLPPT